MNDEILDEDNLHLCPSCGENICATLKVEICKAPNILLIHFKRFLNNKKERKKINSKAYYPDILDLSPFVTQSSDQTSSNDPLNSSVNSLLNDSGLNQKMHLNRYVVGSKRHQYRLYGIIEHIGSLDGGHYVTLARMNEKEWFKFNDGMVQKMKKKQIHSTDAYLLCYEKI
ncbi:hypothetical protein TRFO_11666 [Tritrichomonas foetus]|uniref:USP domain-containing protein n=1 Tax=Tritrichomonas foetus TaxID=1144522 RepID=A0A1J4J2J8_9EUKA|nr:hypothetical protein TRFO_11666 [Tritrichomonas foetus]|eukprot:OHS93662.1 hypothetical protein TRFO_11666 [Tritrichomonas foetus]